MTAPVTTRPRPVQPSVRKQLAQFYSLLDPRCETEAHNRVAQGDTCSECNRSLFDYLPMVAEDWCS